MSKHGNKNRPPIQLVEKLAGGRPAVPDEPDPLTAQQKLADLTNGQDLDDQETVAAEERTLAKMASAYTPSAEELSALGAERARVAMLQLPHEEYLTCQSAWGDLSEAVNLLAKTGRWRLHTVALNSGFCMYVMVRAVGDWSKNP